MSDVARVRAAGQPNPSSPQKIEVRRRIVFIPPPNWEGGDITRQQADAFAPVARYYANRRDPNIVINQTVSTLQGMLDVLRTEGQGATPRPWGEVTFVFHGSPRGINLALLPGDESWSLTKDLFEYYRALWIDAPAADETSFVSEYFLRQHNRARPGDATVTSMRAWVKNLRSPKRVIDAGTTIKIVACHVGRNTIMLRLIAMIFDNLVANVTAPLSWTIAWENMIRTTISYTFLAPFEASMGVAERVSTEAPVYALPPERIKLREVFERHRDPWNPLPTFQSQGPSPQLPDGADRVRGMSEAQWRDWWWLDLTNHFSPPETRPASGFDFRYVPNPNPRQISSTEIAFAADDPSLDGCLQRFVRAWQEQAPWALDAYAAWSKDPRQSEDSGFGGEAAHQQLKLLMRLALDSLSSPARWASAREKLLSHRMVYRWVLPQSDEVLPLLETQLRLASYPYAVRDTIQRTAEMIDDVFGALAEGTESAGAEFVMQVRWRYTSCIIADRWSRSTEDAQSDMPEFYRADGKTFHAVYWPSAHHIQSLEHDMMERLDLFTRREVVSDAKLLRKISPYRKLEFPWVADQDPLKAQIPTTKRRLGDLDRWWTDDGQPRHPSSDPSSRGGGR